MAYVSAAFMVGTDANIVNVTLPTLSRDFAAPLVAVQWAAIAYLLALAVLIPASGWIGDRVGVKQTFVFALGVFTGASVLCAAAHTLGELIAARALQGAGGGLLIPSGTAMLFRTFSVERRARVARMIMVPILIGPASAPILGGALIEYTSWRWVFLVNVPIGLVVVAFTWFYLPSTKGTHQGRLDVPGLLLSGVGLSSLLYAISEGSTIGWDSLKIISTAVTGILLSGLFIRRSLRHRDPLLRIRLLGDRLFRATNIVYALSTGPFLGSVYLTPIFLQEILHQSPVGSGTTTFVEAIGVGIGAQTLARLYPRFGPRVLAAIGSAGLAVYLGLFLLVDPHTNLWLVRALMLYGGVVNGTAFLATQTAMFTTISGGDMGHASAIYNTQRQTTIALNVAIMTSIAAGATAETVGTFHAAYLVAAAIAALGTIAALTLIRTSDAGATMTQRAGLDATPQA